MHWLIEDVGCLEFRGSHYPLSDSNLSKRIVLDRGLLERSRKRSCLSRYLQAVSFESVLTSVRWSWYSRRFLFELVLTRSGIPLVRENSQALSPGHSDQFIDLAFDVSLELALTIRRYLLFE